MLWGPGEFDNDWSPMLTALSLWLTGHVTKDLLLFGLFFFKHLFIRLVLLENVLISFFYM